MKESSEPNRGPDRSGGIPPTAAASVTAVDIRGDEEARNYLRDGVGKIRDEWENNPEVRAMISSGVPTEGYWPWHFRHY